MRLRPCLLAALLSATLGAGVARAEPFTFQAYLEAAGQPIDGSADLRFRMYSAETGGTPLGSEVVAMAYPVAAGVFTADLDFGTSLVFDGSPRYLEVEVNGQVMSPRYAILPAPLASSANALRGRAVSVNPPNAGEGLIWNGAQWAPGPVGSGGSFSAGTGLSLAFGEFSLLPAYRLPQGCGNAQVAKWDGSAWACAADADTTYNAGGGIRLVGATFSLDFAGSGVAATAARSDHDHFGQAWTGSSPQQGFYVQNNDPQIESSALFGVHAGPGMRGIGVRGQSDTEDGIGVQGAGATGVRGLGLGEGYAVGVFGWRQAPGGVGVRGLASGDATTIGVAGSNTQAGGRGIWGLNSNPGAGAGIGVHGESRNVGGRGVLGLAAASSGDSIGVLGQSLSEAGVGVRGTADAASGSTVGVHGSVVSPGGSGVLGEGPRGVRGEGSLYGVEGRSNNVGVAGIATAASGQATGVEGSSASPDGAGVFALNSAASGDAFGVYGQSNSTGGRGVVGDALAGSGSTIGVLGRAASGSGTGMRAENTATSGSGNALQVVGNASGGDSLVVDANGSGSAWAIVARSAGSSGRALNALLTNNASNGTAVYAQVGGAGARAGQFVNLGGGTAASFTGSVDISGTLSKGGGSFKIDHPLDPANKFLLHSFVESPDMMNLYNGNTVTDSDGFASIELPDWFETLNRDFRYQLTVIGSFAQAIVAEEVQNNRFVIRTSAPAVKVSWQISGVRQDAWAQAHRIPVELEKTEAERGRYLHPAAWGLPAEKGLGFAESPVRGD